MWLKGKSEWTRYTPLMTKSDDYPTFADERDAPQLSNGHTPLLSGLEPLLGGARRAKADPERLTLLLNSQVERKRDDVLAYIIEIGQQAVYAAELAKIAAGRAQVQFGSYRGSYDMFQRVNAARALMVIGGYESVIPLLEALAEREYELREAARKALTAVSKRLDVQDKRTAKTYQVMVHSLGMLPSMARKVVTRLLVDTDPDIVLGPLLKVGLPDESWQVRREAAWTLGKIGDQRATKRLVAALQDDVPTVRATAAWALGQLDLDDPVVLGPLADALSDPDQAVRAAVTQALGEQIKWLSTDHPDFAPTLKLIANAFDDHEESVRQSAIDALLAINTPQTRRLLRHMVG